LVLRISRSDPGAGTRNAGVFDAGVRIEAVTRVTHAFRFRQMADYQHTRAAENPTLAALSGIAPRFRDSKTPLEDAHLRGVDGVERSGTGTEPGTETETNDGKDDETPRAIDPTIAYVSVPKGHAFAMAMPDGPARDPFHVAARADAALRGVAPFANAANGHANGHTEDTASEHLTTIGGLIAAPPVSSVTHPEDFGAAFRRRKSRREGESKGPRSSRAGGFADPVPFAVASVPPALADEAVAEAIEAFGVSKEAADAIDAAFEIRTVWAHEALLESLPATLVAKAKTEGAILERAFPLFAFRFKDGPFRRLWVRRGYDPRVRARDAKLQCLEMRLDETWFDAANAKNKGLRADSPARVSKSHRETHGFAALAASSTFRDRNKPPVATRYPLYQLCDVVLPGVRLLLEAFERECAKEEEEEEKAREEAEGDAIDNPASRREATKKRKKKTCSATFGFFSRARFKRARALVEAACAAVYRGDDPVRAEAEKLAELGAEEEEDEDRDGAGDEEDEEEDGEEEEEEEEEEDEEEEEEDDVRGDDDDDEDDEDDGDVTEDGDSDSGGGKRVRLSPVTAGAVRAMLGGAPADLETAIRESAGFDAGQEMEDDEYDVFGEDDDEESD
jgi:hypothetical protein